ncbi:hypothetical protein GRF59_14625 [Paenibacillus sp. HJL G12]|uniref:Uncharacterized protein n=1 Tax=Paenibacillus dendrobii TaxID=2691084 RepID=A0A7X3IIZ6_9BACL|nr:hypothetical protein [Paenibacillus dendrobii]MWV44853.1 hypothetical protein [Paenibacillus dendrobii]
MSLITVVACNQFISVMSDGRIVDRFNNIEDENFNKIKSYEDNLFFSAWGSKAIFDDVAMTLDQKYKTLNKSDYVDEASKIILRTANKIIYQNHPFILLWGGRSKGILKICQLRTPKKQLESLELISNDCISAIGSNKPYAFKYIESELSDMYIPNLDKVIEAQKNTIEHVATMDDTVNNVIFSKVFIS